MEKTAADAEEAENPLDIVVDLPLEKLQGEPVTVAGTTVYIGNLSLDQWIGVSHVFLTAAQSMTPEQTATLQNAKTDIASLVAMLNADSVLSLYSVLTGIDKDKLKASFSMVEFLKVIAAIKKNGELQEVFTAFRDVVAGW